MEREREREYSVAAFKLLWTVYCACSFIAYLGARDDAFVIRPEWLKPFEKG